jgi:NitT/TauT family transport system ATP-binding protein
MISFERVGKVFDLADGTRVTALQDVTLSIQDSHIVSIVGPSGCGKSTLLRIIGGLETLSSGTATIDGVRIDRPSPSVGFMFQSATLLPWMTVLRNVMLPLTIGRSKGDREKRALDLLEMAGLKGFEQSYPYQLSGGMQQRVAVCRALAGDPNVLLMDEPFGALDALTRERMNLELQRIWQLSPKTIVLVTHSIAESVFLSDSVAVMSSRPGRILEWIDVNLPRPRSFEVTVTLPEYHRVTKQIRALLNSHEGIDG